MKVYLTSGLDGLKDLPKGQVSCEFEDNSFDLRIHGLNGKNLRFKVPNLQHNISVTDSKFQLKASSISITLHKEDKEEWTDIYKKK